MFQLQQAAELGSFGHLVLVFRVKDRRRGIWSLFSQLTEVVEASCVAGVSLYGGPEQMVCKACEGEAWMALRTPKMLEMPESSIPAEENC